MLTAIITFFLLGLGGLVTSHEAGMSVPDWPTSYGYNMFALPIKFWKGGAFFEHTHRLLASGVGLLTTILAVWLWLKDSRQWMKWLGVIAFVLVVVQGILGGLRVVLSEAQLGIIHGVVGQAFFILTVPSRCSPAGGWSWSPAPARREKTSASQRAGPEAGVPLRWLVLATTVLIFVQLMLGATMRGQHAGLAIRDFPARLRQNLARHQRRRRRALQREADRNQRRKSHHRLPNHLANGSPRHRAGNFCHGRGVRVDRASPEFALWHV